MAETLIVNRPSVAVGLGTLYTYTVPATDQYSIRLGLTEIPLSSLTVVVNDNGSPIFTAPVIGQTQSAQQFRLGAYLTSGHVITVVLSSSAANDNLLNSVKTTVSLCQGL